MVLFNRYVISTQDWKEFETDKPLSQEERFKFQSATFKTLLSVLGADFTSSELQEVYRLELVNLRNLVTVAFVLLLGSPSAVARVQSLPHYNALVAQANRLHSDLKMRKRAIFRILMLYILKESNTEYKAKFKGKIPPKAFSFRQIDTEKWFSDYCEFIITMGSIILWKSNEVQAYGFFVANTAYYLNKSQTFKYYPKPNESENESIGRIIREFLDDGSAESRNIINKLDTIPFFKDI